MGAFDKVAKKAEPASTKPTTKIAAEVTKDIKNAVDTVINSKAQIKQLEAEKEQAEQAIRDHVGPQQDSLAYNGQHTKSLLVAGNNGGVTYVTSDKFSISSDEDSISALKKLVGKFYDNFFSTKRVISLKPEIVKDDAKLEAFAKVCEKAGISLGDYFDVTDKLISNDDLDAKQYQLPKEKLGEFRTLCRQAKAAIK